MKEHFVHFAGIIKEELDGRKFSVENSRSPESR
jgi:hypothetical protein